MGSMDSELPSVITRVFSVSIFDAADPDGETIELEVDPNGDMTVAWDSSGVFILNLPGTTRELPLTEIRGDDDDAVGARATRPG